MEVERAPVQNVGHPALEGECAVHFLQRLHLPKRAEKKGEFSP
jgi:hypothetical protein